MELLPVPDLREPPQPARQFPELRHGRTLQGRGTGRPGGAKAAVDKAHRGLLLPVEDSCDGVPHRRRAACDRVPPPGRAHRPGPDPEGGGGGSWEAGPGGDADKCKCGRPDR
ncbi:hypothetical protein GCM10010517_41310 [Streptosporangium fragile]|uniref:Uncharacterized protein n=1 Tax=Streptosporangium fragile TaxID=46186 RepID=A0ABN3W0C0_9ACTN